MSVDSGADGHRSTCEVAMTKKKKLKAAIRARQAATGTSYVRARRNVVGCDASTTGSGLSPPTFDASVRRLIKLAAARMQEQREESERRGGVFSAADAVEAALRPPSETTKAVARFLSEQSDSVIKKLCTLMYFGRDHETVGEEDLHGLHEYLAHLSRDEAIASLRKIPLPTYLANGLKFAAEFGIEIEEPFGAARPGGPGAASATPPSDAHLPAKHVSSMRPDSREAYLKLRTELRDASMAAWARLVNLLCGDRPVTEWRNADVIIDVLNTIGKQAPLNHAFYPAHGGMDLSRADRAAEPDCIAINFDSLWSIVRPARLELNVFESDPLREWAYFRLELARLAPTGIYETVAGEDEEVLGNAFNNMRP